MRLYYSIWLVAAIAAVCCSAQDDSNKYVTLQVVDANNFCTFLPPTDSTDRNIADTEYMGNVFCMGNTPKASSAGPIPSGFIQSAHYVATDNYVQVTGQIDPSKANLNATDDGGQYDVAMPRGATCAGWQFFVNLIEPAGHTFCIRCCVSVYIFLFLRKSVLIERTICIYRIANSIAIVVFLKKAALVSFPATILDPSTAMTLLLPHLLLLRLLF